MARFSFLWCGRSRFTRRPLHPRRRLLVAGNWQMQRGTPPPTCQSESLFATISQRSQYTRPATSQQRHFSTALWLISDKSPGKPVARAKSLFFGAGLDPDSRRQEEAGEGGSGPTSAMRTCLRPLTSLPFDTDGIEEKSCRSTERIEHLVMKSEGMRYPASGRFIVMRDVQMQNSHFQSKVQ